MRQATELGVTILLKALVEAAVYRRLAPVFIKMIALLLLSLSLFGACGLLLICQLYLALIYAGLQQAEAMAVMCGGLFVLAALSAFLAFRQLSALRAQLQPLLGVKQKLIGVAHAFSEGFHTASR